MKRSEIIPAVAAVLATAFPSGHVVSDDFTNAIRVTMEAAIRDHGYVVVVKPIAGTDQLGQAGSRPAETASVTVLIRTNAAIVGAPNPYTATDTAITAVLADRTLRAELAQSATALIPDDEGLTTYAINFNVKIIP